MSKIHAKNAEFEINSVDLSAFSNSIEFKRTGDSHDTTCFGSDAHTYQGGLLDGTMTVSGIYDDGAAGPRATVEPLIGTVTTFNHRPEGTGSGLPEDSGSCLVLSYTETEAVADMVMWALELQLSGDVTTGDQS
jgi:hypothetical protein